MKKIVSAVLTAAMTASLMAAPVSVHADEVVTFDVWHSMEGSNGLCLCYLESCIK